jgi:hypothetical protein
MQELSRQAVIGMSSRGTNKEREALHVSVLTMYCKCTVPRHLHSRQNRTTADPDFSPLCEER